ncbi:hypothetical protein LDENG_00267010 [Lucifuga dentata]|nr:hypothetical protein LDENG_00267010 [Lucifuga dentata]
MDFLKMLFAWWGLPNTITTDNGPQFETFLKEKGIKHIHTALYHPAVNGKVEQLNQTLKNGIRAHLAEVLPFSSVLLSTLLHYRVTPYTTTGSSPASLMMGCELQLPLNRLQPQKARTAPVQ